MKTKFGLMLLGICLPLLLGASYGIFSPGGALSGTWNSQNINVGAGSPFVTGLLPAANFGTGTATGAIDWSATQTFSKSFSSGQIGAVHVASGSPRLEITATSASANEGTWAALGGPSTLQICALDDARTSSVCPLILSRLSGTTVASFASNVQTNFSQATNAAWSAVGTNANSAGVRTFWGNTNAAANNIYWGARINESGDFRLGAWSDAAFPTGVETSTWLAADRTNSTIDAVRFQTDNGAGNFQVGTVGTVSASALAAVRTTRAVPSLAVQGNNAGNPFSLVVHNELTAGDNSLIQFQTDASSVRGSITYNRGAGMIAYNVTSSANLKDNIRSADPSGSFIDKIRIRKYEFRESGQTVPHWVIAEELAQDYPLASNGEQVDVTKLVPLMIKELQSLRLRVTDLEAQNFALKNRSAANEDSFDDHGFARNDRSIEPRGAILRLRRPD